LFILHTLPHVWSPAYLYTPPPWFWVSCLPTTDGCHTHCVYLPPFRFHLHICVHYHHCATTTTIRSSATGSPFYLGWVTVSRLLFLFVATTWSYCTTTGPHTSTDTHSIPRFPDSDHYRITPPCITFTFTLYRADLHSFITDLQIRFCSTFYIPLTGVDFCSLPISFTPPPPPPAHSTCVDSLPILPFRFTRSITITITPATIRFYHVHITITISFGWHTSSTTSLFHLPTILDSTTQHRFPFLHSIRFIRTTDSFYVTIHRYPTGFDSFCCDDSTVTCAVPVPHSTFTIPSTRICLLPIRFDFTCSIRLIPITYDTVTLISLRLFLLVNSDYHSTFVDFTFHLNSFTVPARSTVGACSFPYHLRSTFDSTYYISGGFVDTFTMILFWLTVQLPLHILQEDTACRWLQFTYSDTFLRWRTCWKFSLRFIPICSIPTVLIPFHSFIPPVDSLLFDSLLESWTYIPHCHWFLFTDLHCCSDFVPVLAPYYHTHHTILLPAWVLLLLPPASAWMGHHTWVLVYPAHTFCPGCGIALLYTILQVFFGFLPACAHMGYWFFSASLHTYTACTCSLDSAWFCLLRSVYLLRFVPLPTGSTPHSIPLRYSSFTILRYHRFYHRYTHYFSHHHFVYGALLQVMRYDGIVPAFVRVLRYRCVLHHRITFVWRLFRFVHLDSILLPLGHHIRSATPPPLFDSTLILHHSITHTATFRLPPFVLHCAIRLGDSVLHFWFHIPDRSTLRHSPPLFPCHHSIDHNSTPFSGLDGRITYIRFHDSFTFCSTHVRTTCTTTVLHHTCCLLLLLVPRCYACLDFPHNTCLGYTPHSGLPPPNSFLLPPFDYRYRFLRFRLRCTVRWFYRFTDSTVRYRCSLPLHFRFLPPVLPFRS